MPHFHAVIIGGGSALDLRKLCIFKCQQGNKMIQSPNEHTHLQMLDQITVETGRFFYVFFGFVFYFRLRFLFVYDVVQFAVWYFICLG